MTSLNTFNLWNFTFLFFCISYISTVYTDSPSKTVTIFSEPKFGGVNQTLDISTCASSLHHTIRGDISSINSHGNCVNLYKSEHCSGDYIVIQPGTPVHYNLSEWNGFNDNVKSLGPCYPRCDSKSLEKPLGNQSYVVTLWDDTHYKGSHVTMNLSLTGCNLIPLHLKRRISSVQVHGNFCMELHHAWDCKETGAFAQLRPGSPKYENLRHWVGHDNQGVAISLCGYDCDNSTKLKINATTTFNTTNVTQNSTVTIFDDENALFQGHFKNLNLSSHSKRGICVNLDDEWDGQMTSIKTNKHCVTVFDTFNCSNTPLSRNVTIPSNFTYIKSNKNQAEVVAHLKIFSFDRVAQSLKLCDNPNPSKTAQQSTKLSGFTTSVTSIFFIVLFCLVTVSLCSVGVALVFTRVRFNPWFWRSRSDSLHSLMI